MEDLSSGRDENLLTLLSSLDKTGFSLYNLNPEDPSKTRAPEEFNEGNLPDFVEELRTLSDKNGIIDTPPSVDENQKHLKELKVNKASNDVEPELLTKLKV